MKKSKFIIWQLLIWLIAGSFVVATANIIWSANLGNIHRWSWNAIVDISTNPNPTGLGWLSMNCRNDFDNDGVIDDRCKAPNNIDNITYGLTVNLDNSNNSTTLTAFTNATPDYVQGCAWSATFGWVCFDQDSTYCPITPAPANPFELACKGLNDNGVKIEKDPSYPFHYLKSSLANDINNAANKDARAIALNLVGTGSEAQGFIGFPFDATIGGDGKTGQAPAVLGLTGDVTSCFGCTSAQNNGSDACDVCYLVNDGSSDAIVAPNPNIMCTQCSSCNATVRGGSCSNSVNTCAVSSCAKCYTQPGVVVNYYGICQNDGTFCISDGNCGAGGKCTYQNAPAELCGWGFNSAMNPGDPEPKGLGWVAFSPAVYGRATPYVTAKDGSVLSRGDISQPLAPPTGRSSATYLIDAKGSVTRWTSSSSPQYVRPGLNTKIPDFLTFDQSSEQAISSIGSLDIKGLITPIIGQINKYGSKVITTLLIEDELDGTSLGDRVLYMSGSTTIETPVVVVPGQNAASGAGIIYVNGNLTIEADITYSSASVSRLKYIPSLVWIVKGDVFIDPSVNTVAGTFIVLGDGTPADCPAIISTANPPASQGCGRFSTGNDKTLAAPRSLTVYGHVLAKQFLFQRSYNVLDSKNRAQPAETFIADGRVQANPPAGLSELSRSLPKFNFSF